MRTVTMAAVVFFLLLNVAVADEILLKNGTVLVGVIESESDAEVRIRIAVNGMGGEDDDPVTIVMPVKRANIRRITRTKASKPKRPKLKKMPPPVRTQRAPFRQPDRATRPLTRPPHQRSSTHSKVARPAIQFGANGPDEAIRTIIRDISQKKPGTLWQALPKRYRRDLNGLVREFANRMDADIWHSSFRVARKLAKLMRTKQEIILSLPQVQASPLPKADIEANWKTVVAILDVIVKSDLADLNILKTADMEKLLASTGTELLTKLSAIKPANPGDKDFTAAMKYLSAAKFTIVESQQGVVTVQVKDMDTDTYSTQKFVKVEGKWIPFELADKWDENVTKAHASIQKLGWKKADKAKTLSIMAQIEIIMAEMQKANSKAGFEKAIQNGMGAIMPLLMGGR